MPLVIAYRKIMDMLAPLSKDIEKVLQVAGKTQWEQVSKELESKQSQHSAAWKYLCKLMEISNPAKIVMPVNFGCLPSASAKNVAQLKQVTNPGQTFWRANNSAGQALGYRL